MKPITPHPYALILPRHSDADFKALKESIEKHGLQNAVVLYQGKVLDGLGRQRACVELGMLPRYKQFAGKNVSALDFVRIENLERRHLTHGEKVLAARAWCNEKAKEADAHRKAGNFKNGTIKKSPLKSRQKAAKDFGVCCGSIFQAGWLQKHAPHAIEEIKNGGSVQTIYERERVKLDKNFLPHKQRYKVEYFYQSKSEPAQDEVRKALKDADDCTPIIPGGLTAFSAPSEAVRYIDHFARKGFEFTITCNKYGWDAEVIENPICRPGIRCKTWIHAVAAALKELPEEVTKNLIVI